MSWGKDIELLDKMHPYLVETNAKGGGCFPSHTPRFHSVHCCEHYVSYFVRASGRQEQLSGLYSMKYPRCVP